MARVAASGPYVPAQVTPATDGTGNPFGPHRWPNAPDWRISFDSSVSSTPERNLSISSTVLDNVIPAVYGSRRVTGMCGAREIVDGWTIAKFGFIFAFGEQESVSSVEINGIPIAECPWVSQPSVSTHVGDGSTALSTVLTGITDWSAGDTTRWKRFAHVAFWAYVLDPDFPQTLTVTATLGGQEVTDWDSATSYTTNPIKVAYDILTNSDHGLGLAASRVDSTLGWAEAADWADEDPGDGTDRWGFSGILQTRDPDAALTEVLSHCFGQVYPTEDGKLGLWVEMPPTALDDTWTASGTTLTADTSGGNATTRAVGDRLLLGSSTVRTIASITDDDTIILTESATVSGVTARPISTVDIKAENWVRLPEGGEEDSATLADYFRAKYTDGAARGSYYEEAHYGSGTEKRVEATFSGCTVAAQAARLAAMNLALPWLQPFSWTGVADGVAAGVRPGDVVTFSDDVVSNQLVRILPPVVWNRSGSYALRFREFDLAAYTGNETASQPVSVDPSYIDPPDEPTAASRYFVELGDWDGSSMLVPDPDDLTEIGYYAGYTTTTYSAGDDATSVFLISGNTDGYVYATVVPQSADKSTTPQSVIMAVCARYIEDWSDDVTWTLVYSYGSSYSGSTVGATFPIKPPSSGNWVRIVTPPFDLDATGPNHYFSIRVNNSGSHPGSGNEETLQFKRWRVLPWDLDPSFGLSEKWTWTEDSGAPDTVWFYRLMGLYENGSRITLAQVPVGTTSLEFPILTAGVPSNPLTPSYFYEIVDYCMEAWGPGGRTPFPSPTVYWVSREAQLVSGKLRDLDPTDLAEGTAFVYNASGEKFEAKPVALLSDSGANVNTDDLVLGDYPGGDYTEIEGSVDGDINQAGVATFYNETLVETPEFRGKLLRTSLEKSISDSTPVNLFQWDSSDTDSAGFLIIYQVRVYYTQISTRYYIEQGIISAAMVNNGGTVTVAVGASDPRDPAVVNTGTGTFTVTCGTGNGTNYGRINLTCSMTAGPTWNSGEVRYIVVNLDTDNNALSLFG